MSEEVLQELTQLKSSKEDADAQLQNLLKVESFLVQKLQECEAALLTTAMSFRRLSSVAREEKSALDKEVSRLRAEHNLLTAELKDTAARHAAEEEELNKAIEDLNVQKKLLGREVKTLRQSLATSREQLANAPRPA
ncbi:unnamed protein product [Vitrella brassicaformis CCMP3155]|uniref:Uncharacterized protein n=1 Tax=Vitrella brassicaformis (strain CCMP3155) TaxID=1169540 RepID=A0A0G4EJM3_VITBC|nr:unnamed protein product [Vitrella brassicaformis CCMP3155]|eukprot:CEL96708.1 unnamed protein product [Vitrella brassicaformis CCMP3155]